MAKGKSGAGSKPKMQPKVSKAKVGKPQPSATPGKAKAGKAMPMNPRPAMMKSPLSKDAKK